MVMLVSLVQASEHLRRDTDEDDSDLEIKIEAASQAVINYLKEVDFLNSFGEVDFDSAGNPLGVPRPIQMATLLILGGLYTDRGGDDFLEGGDQDRIGKVIIPRAAHFLLDPYRTPTMQ